MPGTLVRFNASTAIAARSLFTPTFSRPRFSMLPVTPTAEMTRSTEMVCADPLPSSIAAVTGRAFGRFVLADLHHDSARRLQCGLAPDHRGFVLAHQEADAVVEPLCHDARALDDRRGIVGDLLGGYPVVLGMLQITVD